MVVWTEDLSVGIVKIDNQHKELYKRIDSLIQAMSQGKGKSEIDGVVAFLAAYVVDHFGSEEKMMMEAKYPKYVSHKALHTAFAKSFIELKAEIDKTGAKTVAVVQTHKCVVDWLNDHISKHDKAFGSFVKAKASSDSKAA